MFDEKYADIFGRKEVNATRVVFLHKLLRLVDASMLELENKPMGSYTLTRYFLLYMLARILREREESKAVVVDPSKFDDAQIADFLDKCGEILKTIIVDLTYEQKEEDFDYKSVFKSPNQSGELATKMLTSYQKDVARNKAESFKDWVPQP